MNHYLYKTTCLHPDAYGVEYVGIRSCNCPIADDVYIGSGHRLKDYVAGYGAENFMKEILLVGDSREYVADMEARYVDIEYVNRSDTLNLMTGGEIMSNVGLLASDDTKALLSKLLRERWSDANFKKRMSSKLKAAWSDQETKTKWVKSLQVASNKPARREQMRELTTAQWQDPDVKEKMLRGAKNKWNDRSYKKHMVEVMTKQNQLKESRERNSARATAQWNDPIHVRTVKASHKKLRDDKDWVAKNKAATREAVCGTATCYLIKERRFVRIPKEEYQKLKAAGLAVNHASNAYKEIKRQEGLEK